MMRNKFKNERSSLSIFGDNLEESPVKRARHPDLLKEMGAVHESGTGITIEEALQRR